MKPEEKLRAMLNNYARAENLGAADNEHLRDENFIRLIENKSSSASDVLTKDDGNSAIIAELAPLRRHLAACDLCLNQFKDFHAFFAPVESHETVAAKSEIDTAWQSFALRVGAKKPLSSFWKRLFSPERSANYFAAFSWGFAATMVLFTGIAAFIAWEAKSENSELAAQLETQKQTSEERLKTLEQTTQNSNAAGDETRKLQAEKEDLQNQIARLQTEIERARQQKTPRNEISSPPNLSPPAPEKPDNSLVAVNTPIYDVFPSAAVVRSEEQTANKLIIPNGAKNVVLILNAAGRADFPISGFSLTDKTGKIVLRGEGLRKDSTGNFTLTLSRAALKAGNYRLKLSGKDKSGAPTAIEYSIAVAAGK